MKNIFNKLMLPNNFSVNQELQAAYGKMDQYHVVLQNVAAQNQLVIHYEIAETSAEMGQAVRAFLASFSSARPHVNFATYQNNRLDVSIGTKGKELGNQLKEAMIAVTDYLVENHAEECCSFCGALGADMNGIYQLDEQVEIMCADCFRRQMDQEAAQGKKKKTNLAAGIVGAVFGSLIGVACWVLIYQLGYIAGLTGFVMMVCCMKGFELLGGRLSRAGVIVSILISIVMLFAAEYLTVGIEIYKMMKEYYSSVSLFEGIRAVPSYLADSSVGPDLWGAMIKDLLMGYVFMVLASISFIRQSFKATAGNTMQKLA